MKRLRDRMEYRPLVSLLVILLLCGIISEIGRASCRERVFRAV